MAYYIVKKFIRASNRWDPIALYDSNNNFRGEAIFKSKEQALVYLEEYSHKLNSKLNVYGKPNVVKLRLRVFEEEEQNNNNSSSSRLLSRCSNVVSK